MLRRQKIFGHISDKRKAAQKKKSLKFSDLSCFKGGATRT